MQEAQLAGCERAPEAVTGWRLRFRAESLTGSTCTCCTTPREGCRCACSQGVNAVGAKISTRPIKCT